MKKLLVTLNIGDYDKEITDLTLVEENRVLIAKYNPPSHHFHPENIEEKYNLQYYAPFFF